MYLWSMGYPLLRLKARQSLIRFCAGLPELPEVELYWVEVATVKVWARLMAYSSVLSLHRSLAQVSMPSWCVDHGEILAGSITVCCDKDPGSDAMLTSLESA